MPPTPASVAAARNPVGTHVKVGKGLVEEVLPKAAVIGAEVLQIFTGNPRGWALSQAVIALAYYTDETNPTLVREARHWLAEVLAAG